jgi:hypothetical protein
MMVFSMHFYKKYNHFFCFVFLASLLGLLPLRAYAENLLLIKNAELIAQDEVYELNANVEAKFGKALEEALLKGFELRFILEFQLASPIKYWFDDEIVTITYPIVLSYHPLSRQFLITQNATQKSFTSLTELAQEFTNLRHIPVIKKSEVEKGENYKALLLIRLDQKKLPKAIQEESQNDTTWEMKSQLFEWVPTVLK